MDKRKFESWRDTVVLCMACLAVVVMAFAIGYISGTQNNGGTVTQTQTQTQTMVINQGQEIYKPNINTCSKSDLMALPNVGEKLAQRIIDYRSKTPIKSINQLNEIEGIGNEIINQLEGRITF